MNKIIGVIGGAGVAATNKLLQIIEESLTKKGAYRDSQHPEMIVWQATSSPSRSMFYEGRGESFIPSYIEIARKLEKAGASVLCMNCNTAHVAYDEIAASVSIPMINIIEEVVNEVKINSSENVFILASDGARRSGVYDRYFSRLYPKAVIHYPDIATQQLLTDIICEAKNKNRFLSANHPDNPSRKLDQIVSAIYEDGADCVVLGCTDLRVVYQNPKCVDSTEILAKAILFQHGVLL